MNYYVCCNGHLVFLGKFFLFLIDTFTFPFFFYNASMNKLQSILLAREMWQSCVHRSMFAIVCCSIQDMPFMCGAIWTLIILVSECGWTLSVVYRFRSDWCWWLSVDDWTTCMVFFNLIVFWCFFISSCWSMYLCRYWHIMPRGLKHALIISCFIQFEKVCITALWGVSSWRWLNTFLDKACVVCIFKLHTLENCSLILITQRCSSLNLCLHSFEIFLLYSGEFHERSLIIQE